MTLIELEKLTEKFLENNDNRADYSAYLQDRDINLLNKVVFNWGKANGLDNVKAKTFSLYIAEKAQRE